MAAGGQWCGRASNPTDVDVVEVGLERTGDAVRSAQLSPDDDDDDDALCTSRRCSSAILDCTYARTCSVTSVGRHAGLVTVAGGRGSSPAADNADIRAGSSS